jgi:1,4-alpha-glucan branching enzyme
MTSVSKDGLVEFWFFRRNVNDVRVVGDFGTPGDGGFALTGGPDGWWRAKVPLDAGEYRFRYVADGAPFPDYASHGIEVSKAGVNSVLVVPECGTSAGRTPVANMVA